MWADYFPDDPSERQFTTEFTSDEVQTVRQHHATWLTVTAALRKRSRATSEGGLGSLVEVQALSEWEALRSAAETALSRFADEPG